MKRFFALALSAVLLFTSGCGLFGAKSESVRFFAMDTYMEITVYGDREAADLAASLVGELEKKLSVTDGTSEISALNISKRAVLSPETAELLASALEICEMTEGALDISIYPAVRLWGFTTGEYRVPSPAELEAVKAAISYRRIELAGGVAAIGPDMQVDLGAVAKGYTGDRIAALLREKGVTSALMNLGGNVHCLGKKPDGSDWRVAIKDPFGDGWVGTVSVSDAAVVTSGGYERFFEENGQTYWHIFDPATAAPAKSGLVSVTVISPSGVLADGLSTALFVMGLRQAAELHREKGGFEAVFVTEDGEVYITPGLEGRFSPSGAYGYRVA